MAMSLKIPITEITPRRWKMAKREKIKGEKLKIRARPTTKLKMPLIIKNFSGLRKEKDFGK